MIFQSRRWRLLVRFASLLIASVLMLTFAGPASYALQDDRPRSVADPDHLFDKEKQPLTNAYISARGLPDRDRVFTIDGNTTTYYWVPLLGYQNLLVVRTEDSRYALPHDYLYDQGGESPIYYTGKLTTLDSQADSEEIIEGLASKGVVVDKDQAFVLLHGEEPKTYRPVVPVFPVLAWVWIAALIGMVQTWRRQPRRRLGKSSVPARHAR